MDRDSMFAILLIIGFALFIIVFVVWAYQQYRLQKEVAEEELASIKRTQYAISQLYKSGALDPAKHKHKHENEHKDDKDIIIHRFDKEEFTDAKTSEPGAELPFAFEQSLNRAELSPDGSKLKYVFPDVDFQMEFGKKGAKPELAVDVSSKELRIMPPPRCDSVTNQYIYELNQKILKQNKVAEEINKKAAEINNHSQ